MKYVEDKYGSHQCHKCAGGSTIMRGRIPIAARRLIATTKWRQKGILIGVANFPNQFVRPERALTNALSV